MTIPLISNLSGCDLAENEPAALNEFKPDGQKLMLVEDNDGAREMLTTFLEIEGYTLASACNGLDAINVFDDFQPSICVVDIGLPDLDGFEVAKKIRQKHHQPDLLIALTGYGQKQDRERVLKAGFDLHIVKPIDPEELTIIISNNFSTTVQG